MVALYYVILVLCRIMLAFSILLHHTGFVLHQSGLVLHHTGLVLHHTGMLDQLALCCIILALCCIILAFCCVLLAYVHRRFKLLKVVNIEVRYDFLKGKRILLELVSHLTCM